MNSLQIISEIKRIKKKLLNRELSNREAMEIMRDLHDFYGLNISYEKKNRLNDTP